MEIFFLFKVYLFGTPQFIPPMRHHIPKTAHSVTN